MTATSTIVKEPMVLFRALRVLREAAKGTTIYVSSEDADRVLRKEFSLTSGENLASIFRKLGATGFGLINREIAKSATVGYTITEKGVEVLTAKKKMIACFDAKAAQVAKKAQKAKPTKRKKASAQGMITPEFQSKVLRTLLDNVNADQMLSKKKAESLGQKSVGRGRNINGLMRILRNRKFIKLVTKGDSSAPVKLYQITSAGIKHSTVFPDPVAPAAPAAKENGLPDRGHPLRQFTTLYNRMRAVTGGDLEGMSTIAETVERLEAVDAAVATLEAERAGLEETLEKLGEELVKSDKYRELQQAAEQFVGAGK